MVQSKISQLLNQLQNAIYIADSTTSTKPEIRLQYLQNKSTQDIWLL